MSAAAEADRVRVHWLDREPPLAPAALWASALVIPRLVRRLAAADDGERAALSGVAAPGTLVLLGEADALPWVDGAVWLGVDPAAPGLYLPTTRTPDVPLPLFDRALRVALGGTPTLLAAVPEGGRLRVCPLDAARPLSARVLAELAGTA